MSINDKKNEVFDIARDIAMKEGLSNLTIRRLARDSDISVGSIYNIFGTKDTLVMELIEDYWTRSLKMIMKDNALNNGDIIDRLEHLYKSFKSASNQFHDDWIKDMVGMNMSNPEILHRSNKYKSIMEDRIKELILSDKKLENIFDEDFNENGLAEFIFENLMILLRNQKEDLGFFKIVLKRLLEID